MEEAIGPEHSSNLGSAQIRACCMQSKLEGPEAITIDIREGTKACDRQDAEMITDIDDPPVKGTREKSSGRGSGVSWSGTCCAE